MKIRWTDEERAAVRREYLILSGLEDTCLRLQRAQQVLAVHRQRPFVKQNAEAEVSKWFSSGKTVPEVETTTPVLKTQTSGPIQHSGLVLEVANAVVAVSQMSWKQFFTGIVQLLKDDTRRLNELNKCK